MSDPVPFSAQGMRFANLATGFALAAFVSLLATLGAAGILADLVQGRGSQVGVLTNLCLAVIVGFMILMFVQQFGPRVPPRLRVPTLACLCVLAALPPIVFALAG